MTTQKQPAVPVSGIASWWEILVPDVDAAASYYATAFGWTSSPFGDDFRVLTDHDGAMVGGLERAPPRRSPASPSSPPRRCRRD